MNDDPLLLQVLKRTLGDIMCDVSRMGSVQKWVTLQPNSEYNSYERCVEKTQLDVRAIADEIAREVSFSQIPPPEYSLNN